MPLAAGAGAWAGFSMLTVLMVIFRCSRSRDDAAHRSSKTVYARCSTGWAWVWGWLCCPFFFFQSPMAARIASSASTEQWIFTGGSDSSFTMSVLRIVSASSTVLPFTHSVAREDDAIAEPQPDALNLGSSMMLVAGFTLICSFITSPHSGAPTNPVPTSALFLSSEPTLRGFEQRSEE